MMDFFYRKTPAYRQARATPQKPSTGWFSSIWCQLFGDGTAVCYRCKDDDHDRESAPAAAPTVAPRRSAVTRSAPGYKTLLNQDVPAADSSDAESCGECPDSDDDGIQEIYID